MNGSSTRHEEFRAYVAARGPVMLRAAMRLTGDRAEAEDLLQAALAKTYLAWDRIHDRAAVDGYVRRAMVNTQISWWRRRKFEVYPTDELPDRPVDDHTDRSEMQDALGRALDRLPARQRAAVVLRYYEDMPEAEIAEILGISVGTVKSTVSRAMAKLRDDAGLEADFPQPNTHDDTEDQPHSENSEEPRSRESDPRPQDGNSQSRDTDSTPGESENGDEPGAGEGGQS